MAINSSIYIVLLLSLLSNQYHKKLMNSKSGLKIVLSSDIASPFFKSEPRWIPDNECRYCVNCQKKFDPIKRKHHCRRCGRIFCSECCHSKRPLPRMFFVDPVRMCELCTRVTELENVFFLQKLHFLTAGASFILSTEGIESQVCICTLSANNSQIVCDIFDEKETIDNINIESIQEYIVTNEDGSYNGAILSYAAAQNQINHLDLKVDGSSSVKNISLAWIFALQEGLKLLKEK